MLDKFEVRTKFNEILDITDNVVYTVKESGVKEGICVVYMPHSTAGWLKTYIFS